MPDELFIGIAVFPGQGLWQIYTACALRNVPGVLDFDTFHMVLKLIHVTVWQRDHPVFVAFGVSDAYQVALFTTDLTLSVE